MPSSSYPRDRFDDIPAQRGRVGAHRAENPHMRGWAIFFWAAALTIVLIAAGIFGTLFASGRITLFPEATPTPTPTPTVTPVIDTSYSVLVLNATPEEGLAGQMADTIIAAGWSQSVVTSGEAGSTDFETTTIYYAFPEDEAAAAGLAGVIGGAELEQNDQYLPPDDPNTEEDESDVKQLTVVLGLDQIQAPEPSPSD